MKGCYKNLVECFNIKNKLFSKGFCRLEASFIHKMSAHYQGHTSNPVKRMLMRCYFEKACQVLWLFGSQQVVDDKSEVIVKWIQPRG